MPSARERTASAARDGSDVVVTWDAATWLWLDDDYALDVVNKLRGAGINADADLRNEKISYKVREHSVAKVPVLMAVGQREVDEETVALRRLGSKQQKVLALSDAISELREEIRGRGQAA